MIWQTALVRETSSPTLVWVRKKSSRISRLLDGTPLMLLEGGCWRERTMLKTRITAADVMAVARDQGLKTLEQIDAAVLERNGEISILPRKKE